MTSYAGVQPPRLAVLVQPMVAATAAGIAFTADPVTGERGCVVIDAVAGIGDRLASGAATPDRWIIRGDAIHQEPTAEAAIDESRARLVADLARRVEAEFGTPQDIEWALVDTEVVLLQARPITALPAEPVRTSVEVPAGYWTRETSHAPLPWRPFTEALTDTLNAAIRGPSIEFGCCSTGLSSATSVVGSTSHCAFGGDQALRRRIVCRRHARRRTRRLLQQWSQEWRPDFRPASRSCASADSPHCLMQPWTPT